MRRVLDRFVAATFLATALIPDSGDSPSPYFLHLAVPFFAVKGVQEVGGGVRGWVGGLVGAVGGWVGA